MKKLLCILPLFFLLFLFGCPNAADNGIDIQDNPVIPSKDGKTYLSLKIDDSEISRKTTIPSYTLTDLVLTGKRNNGQKEILASGASKQELCKDDIEIQTGNWVFTLVAKVDDVDFKAVVSKSIQSGINSVTFVLKPVDSEGNEITTGTLDITIGFAGEANKAKLSIKNVATSDQPIVQNLENISQNEPIKIYKSFLNNTGLAPSTYYVTVTFYCDDLELNTWEAYARIGAGLTSSATITDYNLNEVYTVTYNNIEADDLLVTGSIRQVKFSRKSEFDLPNYVRSDDNQNWYFAGWYTSQSFADGTDIESIPVGTTRDISVYARWLSNSIYVCETGNVNNSGFRLTEAVKSFNEAVRKIETVAAVLNEKNNISELDYYINVMGEVKGVSKLAFSSSDTNEYVTSIKISGQSDAVLNADLEDSVDGEDGTVLTIDMDASVPLTIENLIITGGKTNGNGGGINLKNGKLTLSDGARITRNFATEKYNDGYGGGIYVASGACLIMRGSALVGDLITNNTHATKPSSNTVSCANQADRGGGIYNDGGSVYIGCHPTETTGYNLEDGYGVCYNYSLNGGGLYNAGGTMIIASGTVAYNAGNLGGGLYICSGKSVSLKGNANFILNAAEANGSQPGKGGAVYNGGEFIISGGAKLPNGAGKLNDVYFAANKFLTVDNLQTTDNEIIAYITPSAWTRGLKVLQVKEEDEFSQISVYSGKIRYTEDDILFNCNDEQGWAKLSAPIYVSSNATANDDNNTGTSSSPYASLQRAFGAIEEGSDSAVIYVDGNISNTTNELPDTINSQTVKLRGKNGLNSNGIPNDSIKVFQLNFNSPLTIENLKITGSGSSTETSYDSIYIGENKTLILGDGALVTNINSRASSSGIIVVSKGKLLMYGSAVIGKQSENVATEGNNGNYGGGCGGAIEVTREGLVALGYSSWTSESDNTKKTLTGGIICNYSKGSDTDVEYRRGGGAIFLEKGNNKVYMDSGLIKNNGACGRGGGIYVSEGASFIMTGGTITGNISKRGGGIALIKYVGDDPSVDISGGEIISNSAELGGGIYSQGTLRLSGSTKIGKQPQNNVSYANKSTNGGGAGIYADGGQVHLGYTQSGITHTFTGSISYNDAGNYDGGAIYANGTVEMRGGTISYNKAKNGGGIYITSNNTFNMYGGIFNDNTATSAGGAIYNNEGFRVSADANLYASNNALKTNDVYLASGKVIKVFGSLNSTYVATVTPYSWVRRTSIVSVESGSGVTSDAVKSKFLTTDSDWDRISSESDVKIDSDIYVASSTASERAVCGTPSDTNNTLGTKSHPFASLEKTITCMTSKDVDYKVIVDGFVTTKQKISDTLKTQNGTYNANSVLITGAHLSDEPSDGFTGSYTTGKNTMLTIGTQVPVTIENLKISGGYYDTSGLGGGISVGASSTVILKGKTRVTGNSAVTGGGVYNAGNLVLAGDAIIGDSASHSGAAESGNNKHSNYASSNGGGIYNEGNSKLYLGFNSLNTSDKDNSFSGGIRYNYAGGNGGGVYVNQTEMEMNKGVIEYNSSGASGSEKGGGGLYIISCSSLGSGKGVFINDTVFTKNTVSNGGYGGAVYVSSGNTFSVFGTILIKGEGLRKNDVYLPDNTYVRINQSVTLRDNESSTITITPNSYTRTAPVLTGLSDNYISNNYYKFAVTPDNSTAYYLSQKGKLITAPTAESLGNTLPSGVTSVGVCQMGDLTKVATWVNGGNSLSGVTVTLFDDVELTGAYTPIGRASSMPFSGILEGNNKTINYNGVTEFTGHVGGIVGYLADGTVQNLDVEGAFSSSAESTGGIVGNIDNQPGIIKNCSSHVNITSSNRYVGGIVGKTYINIGNDRIITIDSCINYGSITMNHKIQYATGTGGILGYSSSCIIKNCLNKGNITGFGYVGGISGNYSGTTVSNGVSGHGSEFFNCGNTGKIIAKLDEGNSCYAGGITGGSHCGNINWSPLLKCCFSSGEITSDQNPRGLVGMALTKSNNEWDGYIENCIYHSAMSSQGAIVDSVEKGQSYQSSNISNYLSTLNTLNSSNSSEYKRWKVDGTGFTFVE